MQDLVANSEAPLSDYLNWMLLFMCSDSGSVNVHHLSVNMQVIVRCVQMSNSTRVKRCSQLISTGLNKVVLNPKNKLSTMLLQHNQV